jgi:hypothetical protein
VGALDLPSEPEEPDRVRDHSVDRPKTRDLPDPDERGRAYEAMRAHVSAETRDEPGRSYRDEAPRFLDQAADLRRRWPAERQAAPDRPDDPPGSFRSGGGFYLNPERHADAVAAIERVRKAEPGISADMQEVERENGHGGWLEGLEFRRKGDDRLKEKVAERLEGEPDKTSAEILRKVPDAIRYTFCLGSETYSQGYYGIKERLENCGYQMYESKNAWGAAEYKGINTRWVTEEGQRFEVQFHTAESFHAKQHVTHGAYERIRDPWTIGDERAELRAFQREVCSYIRIPDGARDIPDFKKEGF